MAINIDKIKARLSQYESGSKSIEFTKLLWKPKDGTSQIRIVPYRPNGVESDSPFIELKFYYGIAGKTYLAPCTFGKPDPIQELVEAFFQSDIQSEKDLAKKLSAKTRIYVPIIVRGEEHLGVRFWGFGVLVHRQLLELIGQDGGDITSLVDGNDIKISFKKDAKKSPTGELFPETIITPVLKKTTAVSANDKEAMESIKNQLDINTVFPLKPYAELKSIVEAWLNPGADTDGSPIEPESIPASATEAAENLNGVAVSATQISSPKDEAAKFASFFAS